MQFSRQPSSPGEQGSVATIDRPNEERATTPHRQDLNGLRGLAIGLVVVFHVWFGRVSGGVDVFLVLSGYFFVGSLVRRAEAGGSLNPVPALRRVFLRLFPLIAVVSILTALGTALLLPRTRWADLGDQLIAVLGFFQNWQLASTASDYLAADGSVTPLQHLWSMAVQGQFYLLAIALVSVIAYVASRVNPNYFRPSLAVTLLVLTAGSFLYALAKSSRHQAWAYYDSGARLWELALGGLLAVLMTSTRSRQIASLPFSVRATIGWAGLSSILLCGIVLDGAQQFPGPWALVPVLATLALILSGVGDDTPWTSKTLAHPALTWLGSFAFALYLIHWPILVFALVITGRPEAGLLGGTLIIALSVAGALALRRLVEVPVERGGRSRRYTVLACVVTAAVVLAASVAWQSYASSQTTGQRAVDTLDLPTHPGALALTDGVEVPKASMVPSIFDAPLDLPASTLDGCIADFLERDVVHCTYGDADADRTIALAGWFALRALAHCARRTRQESRVPRRHVSEDGLPAHHRLHADVVGQRLSGLRRLVAWSADRVGRRLTRFRVHDGNQAEFRRPWRRDARVLRTRVGGTGARRYRRTRHPRYPVAAPRRRRLPRDRLSGDNHVTRSLRDATVRNAQRRQSGAVGDRRSDQRPSTRPQRRRLRTGVVPRRGGKCTGVSRFPTT